MLNIKSKHADSTTGPDSFDDTMGNSVGKEYGPAIRGIVQKFPELLKRHSPPEIIISLVSAGIISNRGNIRVSSELQAALDIDKHGNPCTKKSEPELLREAIEIANREFDGHLTIGKFTSNWQVFGRTPESREDWNVFPSHKTLRDALESFVVRRPDLYKLGAKKNG